MPQSRFSAFMPSDLGNRTPRYLNIFAARKIKPTGDGKTKETAFFFPGARDAKESFEIWVQYLENRKIVVRGWQLAAMEGSKCI
jgi:hypothetical protein